MKKRIFALVCLLMCLFGMKALAQQTLELADWNRIDPNLPAGLKLVGRPQRSDGELHIVIDTYATDWDMVAAAARKSNTLVIHPGIHAPEGAQGNAKYTDYYRENNQTLEPVEQRIASQFAGVNPKYGQNNDLFACSYQGIEIGRFDEVMGLFLPKESSWEQGFAVCWRMPDRTDSNTGNAVSVFRNERVRISVSYSDLQPVYLKRQKVAEADIAGNVNTGGSGMVDSSAVTNMKISNGRIVYNLSNAAAGREVFTAVAAPSWANAAYLISNGEETPLMMNDGIYISGKRSAVLYYTVLRQDCLYKQDWAIKWVDTQSDKLDVYSLEAEFHIGNPKLTVTYDRFDRNNNLIGKAAKPLTYTDNGVDSDDRLKWTFENPLKGLDATYENGVLTLTVEEKDLPPNRKIDLSQTNLVAQVKVPENAVYCNVFLYKGDVIYGNHAEGDRLWYPEISVEPGEFFTVPELTRGYFMPCYYTLHNGKRICYYAPKSAVGQHGGEAVIFEWLNKDKMPIDGNSREFVVFQSDSYHLPVRQNQSLDEKIKDTVEGPMVVAIDAADKDMDIEAAVVPQVGDDIVRYDVVLYDDATGEKADPGHPVLLYLPYPDGKSMEEMAGYEFVVYHPRKDGVYEEFSVANGNLTLTEYGLCLEAASFSPYYLSWEPAPDASALPETGDRSVLWLCTMMLAASAAGMITMKKKKTAA